MNDIDTTWIDIIVAPDTTITNAISVLNVTGKMFLLIADEDRRLLGNLTDGDLRKGLLKFNDLSTPISSIMNTSPKTVQAGTSDAEVISIFQNSDIKALPVVDDKNILQGCYFEGSFRKFSNYPCEMMIMAGGFGRRMGELTKDLPKPMLEVEGKPILAHIIEFAKRQGFTKFYISVHYLAEKIMSHFGDGKDFGVEIKYLEETTPLGTGGSIKLLPDGNAPVVVTNADVLTKVSFRAIVEFHSLTNASATIGTHEHVMENPFGVVHAEGIRVSRLEEKPTWKTNVNAGVYVINRSIREHIKDQEYIDMPDVFKRLLEHDQTVVQYPIHEDLFEIGTSEKFKAFTSSKK